jgi:hypothetical protein
MSTSSIPPSTVSSIRPSRVLLLVANHLLEKACSSRDITAWLSLTPMVSYGIVDSTRHVRWDDDTRTLNVPSLSSFSKTGLEIKTDVDFMAHQLKNFTIEANTTLSSLVIKDGIIDSAILTNCTATGLSLSDVALDSLSVTKFDTIVNVGSLVLVGDTSIAGGRVAGKRHHATTRAIKPRGGRRVRMEYNDLLATADIEPRLLEALNQNESALRKTRYARKQEEEELDDDGVEDDSDSEDDDDSDDDYDHEDDDDDAV